MILGHGDAPLRFQRGLKLAVLAAAVAVAGLPINGFYEYGLLVLVVVVICVGRVTSEARFWALAGLVVLAALTLKLVAGPLKIEEGHNVFLPDGAGNALVAGLPPEVFAAMKAEFDRAYPSEKRCRSDVFGCWQDGGRPNRVYAFSFDGLYERPMYSRRVTGIDFSGALWQRLGFVNESIYNWGDGSDVTRGVRPRSLRDRLHDPWNPWRIVMPHFVMFSFPAALAGSELCWRGDVLWETPDGRFPMLRHEAMQCRAIQAQDAGRRIYGLAIAPDAGLAMTLRPDASIWLRQVGVGTLVPLLAIGALLGLLVTWRARRLVLPLTLLGLSLVVMALNDVSFLGGARPFDGGNDGLVYDGYARLMTQSLLRGDIAAALMGLEPVFYFTPGTRYLRVAEHAVFGETQLGSVSLMLLLPFAMLALFRRFLPATWALAAVLVFVAVPIGTAFGSTFYLYVKHAAQGFGDPAAAVFFLAGLAVLAGRTRRGPAAGFWPAAGAGLLFALALFVRPNFALGAAAALGCAGLAALWQAQFQRLAGLCIGFAPVLSMAAHNWYFGGRFVLFSGHTSLAESMPMPPGAYLTALGQLLRLDLSGAELRNGAFQIANMLTGPLEVFWMVPLHVLAVAVVVRVLLSARYDPWLRVVAGATLGLHAPGLFFIFFNRYVLVAWLLMLLICSAWLRIEGLPWFQRRFPAVARSVLALPPVAWGMRRFGAFTRAVGVLPRRTPAVTSAA